MEEIKTLKKKETQDDIELLKGKTPIDCTWVFTITYKTDGIIERYKVRLVTKGLHKPTKLIILKHLHKWPN